MHDDKYYFDEDEYAVRANRSGKKFTLGDKVQVKLIKADLRLRQVDFSYVVER